MSCKLKILLLFILGGVLFNANSQTVAKQAELHLFTDRDFCMSGDTLWFKVWVPDSMQQKGNVVHVQLDSRSNNLISNAISKSKEGWAEGFMFVPDSLSSGQYFVTAFLNAQRNLPELNLRSKSLFVYNRFEEGIFEMEISQVQSQVNYVDYNNRIKLVSNKNEYLAREKVTVNIEFDSAVEIEKAIVNARIIDPLTQETESDYQFALKSSFQSIPDFVEQDGFLLSGLVVDEAGEVQKGILVVLSISGEPPYFDYFITGEEGGFHFFLKNATGTANVVLQAISQSEKEYFIQRKVNSLERKDEIHTVTKTLTTNQTEFISSIINGNFIDRLFNPSSSNRIGFFEMPARFETPFYGTPTERVIPDDFIDLPDFKEISRELLHGVQFRNRNNQTTIRILNEGQGEYFANEPLRLLNGIPVFKNSLFDNLNSVDISYVDIVQRERIYGDLSFKGILAVSLNDKSNGWMAKQPNIFQFDVVCLQPKTDPGYLQEREFDVNQPDMRQVYHWEILQSTSGHPFEFFLSDLKGKVEIVVVGTTKNDESFKTSKIVEVK